MTVTVNGSHESGKRIIFEAMAATICGDNPVKSGHKAGGEFWRGVIDHHPVEIGYIDTPYSAVHGYDVTNTLLHKRELGGARVIQNSRTFSLQSGISVWVEKATGWPQSFKDSPSVKRQIDDLCQVDPWARYVEITIRDPRLLRSKTFRDSFNAFAPVNEESTMTPMNKLRSFIGLTPKVPKAIISDQPLPVYEQSRSFI